MIKSTFDLMDEGLACPLCGLTTEHKHRNPWFGVTSAIPEYYTWYPPSHEKENANERTDTGHEDRSNSVIGRR